LKNCGRHRFSRFMGVRVGVANFFLGQSIGKGVANFFLGQSIGRRGKLFLGQSIGIDETNTSLI